MPYISEVDRADISFGIENDFDFLAASFVRSKQDIMDIRSILEEKGSDMKIIAKIENMQGIENAQEILDAADGIMVARGDMGVEIPLEEVPILQKRLIKMANAKGKHVITATQMLESMIKNPRPTRAEATDIANAIYDGTTAIMLSGESASGAYPVEAVKTMARIAESAEEDIDNRARMDKKGHPVSPDITQSISYGTCSIAMDVKAAAIITVTMSGFTAEKVANYKPDCQIIAGAVSEKICRQMNLLWGVTPILLKKEENQAELFRNAVAQAKNAGYINKGDMVVITAGLPLGISGNTNMIRVIEVV